MADSVTGAFTTMKVSDFLKNQRSKFTHLIFSVNGAHENYQAISCAAEIMKKQFPNRE
jgi:DNA-directed RNA polymerase alpha subunit